VAKAAQVKSWDADFPSYKASSAAPGRRRVSRGWLLGTRARFVERGLRPRLPGEPTEWHLAPYNGPLNGSLHVGFHPKGARDAERLAHGCHGGPSRPHGVGSGRCAAARGRSRARARHVGVPPESISSSPRTDSGWPRWGAFNTTNTRSVRASAGRDVQVGDDLGEEPRRHRDQALVAELAPSPRPSPGPDGSAARR